MLNYLRMDRSPKAIKSLDGLRGIAILLVLFRHAIRPFYNETAPEFTIAGWDPMIIFRNGWIGVDLFFVLSGFLVTYHLLKRAGTAITFETTRDYLVKRFYRIVPTYYVFMLIVCLGVFPHYEMPRPNNVGTQVIQHLLFMQDYYGAGIVGAFWSLGVEEKFYFLAPFLVWLVLREKDGKARASLLRTLIVVPIVLRCTAYFTHPGFRTSDHLFWVVRSPFHCACDAMLMGSLCAVLLHHKAEFPKLLSSKNQKRMLVGGTALIGTFLTFRPLLDQPSWFNGTILLPLLGFGFAMILLSLVLDKERRRPILDSRVLFFLSKISYSLYLVHMVFLASVLLGLQQFEWFNAMPPLAQFAVYFPVHTMVSIVASLVLHYVVEKPFLIIKDRYKGRPAVQRAAGVQAHA